MSRLPIEGRPNLLQRRRNRGLGVLAVAVGIFGGSLLWEIENIRHKNGYGQVHTWIVPGPEFCNNKAGVFGYSLEPDHPGVGVKLEGKIYESKSGELAEKSGLFNNRETRMPSLRREYVTLSATDSGGFKIVYYCPAK